jgi:hypothetical protein
MYEPLKTAETNMADRWQRRYKEILLFQAGEIPQRSVTAY